MMTNLTRRHFLGGLTGALFVASPGRAAAAVPAPCPSPAWSKQGVVLRHSQEPSAGWIQNFTSPAEPLRDGRWRLWCSVSGKEGIQRNIGFADGVPGEEMKLTYATLAEGEPDPAAPFALGNLPPGWRPVQVVHLRLADGRHRIYFWAHAKGVVRYLAADSADGRAYRVVDPLRPCIYHPSDRAVDGKAAVAAGLSRFAHRNAATLAGEPLAPPALISNDATNVYQLRDGTFEMYSVALVEEGKDDPRYFAHDNIPGLIRVIDRFVSADGLRWEGRRRVITPDTDDPPDLQFYYLSVTHTDRGRVGILGHYHLETQTIDMEWCFSEDGIRWQRPHRKPWLPRGDASQPDSYMLHAPSGLVQLEGKWWLFYTGGNFAHNHRHTDGHPNRAVLLATCTSIWS
ncbi:MAG: hypothetical protein M3463_22470 [Verrucomicrobiota bacterium]|nr:hypothetical protein [Verrucomicrobiota bacterium]